jgi:hypothetical protein
MSVKVRKFDVPTDMIKTIERGEVPSYDDLSKAAEDHKVIDE